MKPRRVALWFAASFWVLFGLISGIQVWISMITHGHSVPLLIGYNVIVWGAWFFFTGVIVWLEKRFPLVPPKRLAVFVHILAACSIAVIHTLFWLGAMLVMRPYDRMTAELAELRVAEAIFFRLPLEGMIYCLVLGAAMAFDFYERYRDRTLQAAQLEVSLADARLHALELQIQPHFLFNTLNAVSSLVRSRRNEEAVTMIAGLSDLLRYTLDHAGEQHVALQEELVVLGRYLEIQHSRFPDRMSFTIDAAPDTLRGAVPTLLLQPLAENAVRHGIAMSAAPGVVEIRAFRSGDALQIEVFNSGALDARAARGIGLRNTLARLQHLYGQQARFDLAGAKGGVMATVSIPWEEVA
jgi:hypothetical protein